MGSGRWDYNAYEAAEAYRQANGRSAFDYNDRVLSSTPRNQWRAHPDLEPYGVAVRESRDSAEHPTSLAISVLFDVTGSMGGVPRVLQTKLADLHGLLLRKGYVDHPQIMFGAIGDAYSDRVPLQVGQFESDNRMDEQLGEIVLEGGGGGQMRESYELAMYFMAHHTALDCHEKRGKRGYLFIIGDEMPYPNVNPQHVSRILGQGTGGGHGTRGGRPGEWPGERPGRGGLPATPIEDVVRDLTRKFDVYYILPEGSSYVGNDEVLGAWRALLGQNVIQLDDLDAVCETIALTIGLAEDRIDLHGGLEDLRDVGSRAGSSVERALGSLDNRRGGGRHNRHHPSPDPAVRYLRTQGANYTYDSGYDNRPEGRW
ncbi:hypothetical protein ABH920_001502 [Catenulispora sp. EB89]|uniref:hypothetical protein n=1 Tax=Catenulispora sp. EB89 TaxID=3156257 RepID=UPI00351280D0